MQRHRNLARIAFCLLAWVAAAPAGAVPLDQLDSGAVPFLDSGSGQIRFSGFSATPSGDLPATLSSYDISATALGITIAGPLSVSGGEAGTLTLEFDVSVLAGGFSLAQARLDFAGSITDPSFGAFTAISEDLLDAPGGNPIAGDPDLSDFATSDGPFAENDTAVFTPRLTLHVLKDINLSTTQAGQSVTLTSIDQAFTLVPEPASAALLALGLVALGLRRG